MDTKPNEGPDKSSHAFEMGSRLVLPGSFLVREVAAVYGSLQKKERRVPEAVDFGRVEEFDTSALAFMNLLRTKHPEISFENVPDGLAEAFAGFSSKERLSLRAESGDDFPAGFWERLGTGSLRFFESLRRFLVLLADELHHSIQYIRTRRGVYPGEIWNQLHFMAYRSYPIVCVMIFLVGVTISLTSAAQLRLFGADIYLAPIVGIAMVRELVPLMTGIILAGKIGAAITAEISTMNVLEEIDALKTMGVAPERFLMVPRLFAVTLAVPLLVALADFVGILGGILVAQMALGIPPSSFLREMMTVVFLKDFAIGLGKTMVFGWSIVVASGFKGFFVRRSAGEVGRATTESVVLSIALIILLDCVFAFIFY